MSAGVEVNFKPIEAPVPDNKNQVLAAPKDTSLFTPQRHCSDQRPSDHPVHDELEAAEKNGDFLEAVSIHFAII